MRVAVIGSSGGMGSYLVRYFLARGHDVAGSDIIATKAHSKRFKFYFSNAEAARSRDVVVVASPIDTTISVVRECARSMSRGSVLVDISSVKGKILPELRKLTSENGVTLLSIHPLFGPSLRSRRGMKLMVISDDGAEKVELAGKLFADAEILPVTGSEHDRLVALTLALTHIVNMLYAKTISKYVRPEQMRLVSTPTSMTQLTLAEGVLSQNPKLYSYIQMENPNTPDVIKTLSKNTAEVLRIVERGDRKAFERLYADLAGVYSEDGRKNRSLSAVYEAFQRKAQ